MLACREWNGASFVLCALCKHSLAQSSSQWDHATERKQDLCHRVGRVSHPVPASWITSEDCWFVRDLQACIAIGRVGGRGAGAGHAVNSLTVALVVTLTLCLPSQGLFVFRKRLCWAGKYSTTGRDASPRRPDVRWRRVRRACPTLTWPCYPPCHDATSFAIIGLSGSAGWRESGEGAWRHRESTYV